MAQGRDAAAGVPVAFAVGAALVWQRRGIVQLAFGADVPVAAHGRPRRLGRPLPPLRAWVR